MNTHDDFTQLQWIKNFADHFHLPVQDVKLVYQVFLGNRVQDWPHPFGELEPWVASFDSAETKAIRDGIVREKGWHGGGGGWNSLGVNVLQNEIYRRTPESQASYSYLKKIILDFRQKSADKKLSFLDYGCGTANLVETLVNQPGFDFHLCDINPVLATYCRHKFQTYPQVKVDTISTRDKVTGDQCRVRTKRRTVFGRYDIVHTMDVLEHTLNPLGLLIQMIRALNPDGLLIFLFPDNIEGDWHTPEANFLRPYCLELVERLFTPIDGLVWQKTADPIRQNRLLRKAALHDWLNYHKAKRFARQYFLAHPPPER